MPPSNRPVTLQDLQRRDGTSGGGSGDGGTLIGSQRPVAASVSLPSQNSASNNNSNNNYSNKQGFVAPKVYHIPSLPRSEEALSMLQRVVGEFLPIIQRRGYNVSSISELCCCNDGLDFAFTAAANNSGKRPRKLRKMANNIWGYNRTTWSSSSSSRKSHTIHLRLRHVGAAHTTRMHVYEDVAGTLAHELAHCEYGPHNDKFYKLMDDILDEHATLMASSSLTSSSSFPGMTSNSTQHPAFGGTGHVLGGQTANTTAEGGGGDNNNNQDHNKRGQKLGGDGSFQQWMTPREAAVAAAMARQWQQQLRLRGNRCCRPCNVVIGSSSNNNKNNNSEDEEEEIIEIIETDPNLLRKDHQKQFAPPPPAMKKENRDPKHQQQQQQKTHEPTKKRPQQQQQQHADDGTTLDNNNNNSINNNNNKPPAKKKVAPLPDSSSSSSCVIIDLTTESDDDEPSSSSDYWSCSRCTFSNPPSQKHACLMCNHVIC